MKFFTFILQLTLVALLVNQSHLLLRDCVLRTNFEIRFKESFTFYMQHPTIGPLVNPALNNEIKGKRHEHLNNKENNSEDLPLLFLANAPIYITIHS